MQLRSPAEFYYKYLVVHPDGYENAEIREGVDAVGVDWISNQYVDHLRTKLKAPQPFKAYDWMHTTSFQFLCDHHLVHLFQPDADMGVALSLLELPRAREFVETMLLSHAPHGAIAKAVARYGQPCTERTITLYAHYFWNVSLLDSTQMKILLNWRFERMQHDEGPRPEAKSEAAWTSALGNAGKKASYNDPRRLAAELPFSPFAAMLVQMRMGVMPSRIDIAARMTDTRNMAALRALEVLQTPPAPGDAVRALNYAMTAKIMNEMLETVQKPDETLRDQLSAIALRTDDRPVPSIHALSAGRHTVDLQPTPDGTYERKSLADETEPPK